MTADNRGGFCVGASPAPHAVLLHTSGFGRSAAAADRRCAAGRPWSRSAAFRRVGPRRCPREQHPAPDGAASRIVPCGACPWPKPIRRSGHRATKDAEKAIGVDRRAAVAADVQPPKPSECSPSRSQADDANAPACPDDALSGATPQRSRRAMLRSDRVDAPMYKSGRPSGYDRSRWTGHKVARYEGSALPASDSGSRRSFPHRRGASPARSAPGCRTSHAGARYTSSASPSHASGREWWRVRSGSRRQVRQSTSARRARWGSLPESLQHRHCPYNRNHPALR